MTSSEDLSQADDQSWETFESSDLEESCDSQSSLNRVIRVLEGTEVDSDYSNNVAKAVRCEQIDSKSIKTCSGGFDEFELKLMEMFESNPKVNILRIETLPAIDEIVTISDDEISSSSPFHSSHIFERINDASDSEILSGEDENRDNKTNIRVGESVAEEIEYHLKGKDGREDDGDGAQTVPEKIESLDNEKVTITYESIEIEDENFFDQFFVPLKYSTEDSNLEITQNHHEDNQSEIASAVTQEIQILENLLVENELEGKNMKRKLSPSDHFPEQLVCVKLPKFDLTNRINELQNPEDQNSLSFEPLPIEPLLEPESPRMDSTSDDSSVMLVICEPEVVNVSDDNSSSSVLSTADMLADNATIKECSVVLKVVDAEKLMPWISTPRTGFKYEICYTKMIERKSLIALFKCMDSRCSFATNDDELFRSHLIRHQSNETLEENFHQQCSYCLYQSTTGPEDLAHHIIDIHSYDIYQCAHCFFRSREKETCHQHMETVHCVLSKMIIKWSGRELSDERLDERLKRNRAQFVVPMKCKCGSSTTSIGTFLKYFLVFFRPSPHLFFSSVSLSTFP